MSEVAQGPDWWQASDGKWYPPAAPAAASAEHALQPSPRRGPLRYIAAVVAAVIVIGAIAVFLTRGGGGTSTAGFCDQAKSFASDPSLKDSTNDPKKLANVVKQFDSLTSAAPSSIKADMTTFADLLHRLAAALRNATSSDAQLGAVLSVFGSVDQTALSDASKRVDTFTKGQCGVDLNFSGSSSDTSFDSSFSFSDVFSS